MIASLAGIDSVVGYEGERVLGSQSSYADPNASLHAAFGILAALWRREQTGAGAYLDLSQWEAALSVMGEQAARFAIENEVLSTCGTRHASKAPYGNYPAAGEDRWIAIAVADEREWDALRRVLDEPDWMASAPFSTAAARRANRSDLDVRLASETRKYDNAVLATRLGTAGVAAAPLLDAHGVAAEHRFATRGLFEHVKHPILGSVPVYRLPWHVNGSPLSVPRRAPLLGEHNAYTLETVLGYTSERIRALQEAGVFA
jgi:benzylsuccinate CoA-transferase BbsF subunit